MFSHIQLGTRDLDRLAGFYDAVLAPLGLVRMPEEDDGGPAGVIWQRPGARWPQFVVQYPFNALPPYRQDGYTARNAFARRPT